MIGPLIHSENCKYDTRYYGIQDTRTTFDIVQGYKFLDDKNQALVRNGKPNTECLVGTVVDDDPRMGFKRVHLDTRVWLDSTIRYSFSFKVQPPELNRCAADIYERDLSRVVGIQRFQFGFVACVNGVQKNLFVVIQVRKSPIPAQHSPRRSQWWSVQ